MTRPNRPTPKALHHTWRAFTHHATKPRLWLDRQLLKLWELL